MGTLLQDGEAPRGTFFQREEVHDEFTLPLGQASLRAGDTASEEVSLFLWGVKMSATCLGHDRR